MTTEKKSWGKLTVLGIQHVFAMFGATVLVPLITGMNPAVALFCAGVGTIIFHLVTKRKVPVFLGSSFAFMGAIIVVTEMYGGVTAETYPGGLPYATGGILVAGALYLVLSLLVKLFGSDRVRSFFPPVVTGPIIIIIGLMLAPVAINNVVLDAAQNPLAGSALLNNWIIAAITIISMLIVSVFTKGFFKMVPILIGIIVGYITALIFNAFGAAVVSFESIASAQWIAIPSFFLPKFTWQAIVIIAPIAIVTFVEHIGDITANGAVVNQDFFKDPGLHRTLIGDGVATMLAGAIGGPANTTYSENTGVLAATRNYNPVTLQIAAVFAILMSLVGKFGGFLQTLPSAVMGGISIILFGMITSVGLRTLVEGKVDFKNSRNMLIAALMLVMGLGGAAFQVSSQISIAGVALAAILGIILNKALPDFERNKNSEAA